MEEQLVPARTEVVYYESHMLAFLSNNKDKAYNYLELSTYLKMSRKCVKNIARCLKRMGRVTIKPMNGERKVRCGFEKGKDGLKRPSYKQVPMSISYVMVDKKWLGTQTPTSTPAA